MAKHRRPTPSELVAWLASGGTASGFARRHGMPERTARDWAQRQEVRKAVDVACREQFKRASAVLSRASRSAAVQTVRIMLMSVDPKIRLAACKIVLDQAVRLTSHAELLERLEAIEKCQNEPGYRLPPRSQPPCAADYDEPQQLYTPRPRPLSDGTTRR